MTLTFWTPPEHPDILVSIDNDTGMFIEVVKGNLTLKKVLQDHRDSAEHGLTIAQKAKFNQIHKPDQRPN